MLEYKINARRLDASGSEATTEKAIIRLDTGVEGNLNAFNPAELYLASLAACIIKNIERVSPIIKFEFRQVKIAIQAKRQDSPPEVAEVYYRIEVDTDEKEQRLELLHKNIKKYGTIYNTVKKASKLEGDLTRMKVSSN